MKDHLEKIKPYIFPIAIGLITITLLWVSDKLELFLNTPEVNFIIAVYFIFFVIFAALLFSKKEKINLSNPIDSIALSNFIGILVIVLPAQFLKSSFFNKNVIENYCILITVINTIWCVHSTLKGKAKHDTENLKLINRICVYLTVYFSVLTFFLNGKEPYQPFLLGALAVHLLLPVYQEKLSSAP